MLALTSTVVCEISVVFSELVVVSTGTLVMAVLLTEVLFLFSVVLKTVAVVLSSGDMVNSVAVFTCLVWLKLMELSGLAGDGPTSDLSSVCTIQYKRQIRPYLTQYST